MLVHLRSFFDLWDAFVLQAVEAGQPYISDHLMFEVCIICCILLLKQSFSGLQLMCNDVIVFCGCVDPAAASVEGPLLERV